MLDIHVHLAGSFREESGCHLDARRAGGLAFRLILATLRIRRRQLPGLGAALLARLRAFLGECPHLRVVTLALDWARDEQGNVRQELTDLFVPNDYVLGLARTERQLLAGVSVHPLRPDAVQELERCHRAGAVLVKWLPVSQNFSPADERCAPFYAALARLGLPLLSHTGSEGATRNLDKRLNDPRLLRPALEAGVTVIAAHSGMRSLPHDRDYAREWQAMLKDYPRFYGDTAALFGLRARSLVRLLDGELVVERLVHGSDWPVPASPWWFAGVLPLRRLRALARVRNPLLRDLEIKRALGLPAAVFSRGLDLLGGA